MDENIKRELIQLLYAASHVTQHIRVEDEQTNNGAYRWQRVEFDWHGTTYVYQTINGSEHGLLHDLLMLKLFADKIAAAHPDCFVPEVYEVRAVDGD